MPHHPLDCVLHHLRRTALGEAAGDRTDAQLLDAFVRRRDECAFELLLRRHAALVLGACRRVLRDRHEAEDAFQATFLVFVRKAGTISKHGSVAGWLHRVAIRVAQRARARSAKQAHQPFPDDDFPARAGPDEVLWRDLRPVLDEEVDRLPEKIRRPFVLCYLEGITNEQAARQIGCPQGTILSRLGRGRERLRQRLARRGIVLSSSALAPQLISQASDAAVPAALIGATTRAGLEFAAGATAASLVAAAPAAWTEGVLRAMFMTRMKIAGVIALAALLAATGAGLLTGSLRAQPRASGQEKSATAERRERGEVRRPGAQRDVRGVVEAVDAEKGTFDVNVGFGRLEPAKRTFLLGKNTEIGINRGSGRFVRGAIRTGKRTDLVPGVVVQLHLAPDEKTVEYLVAEGPMVHGTIKAVDAGNHTLTLTWSVPSRERGEAPQQEEKTYTVDAKTEIGTDDGLGRLFSLKAVKLAELPVGAHAALHLSIDLKHVQTVVAEGATVSGKVKSVDADKKQITLTTRAGRGDEGAEEKTYDVTSDAEVLLDDGKGRYFSVREGKLGDIPAESMVVLRLTPDQQKAVIVRAEGPSISGAIKAVDADKHTITVLTGRNRDGTPAEEKTLPVAKDARIIIDGKESKLADVKADENGHPAGLKLSLDQKVVHTIWVGERRR